MALLKKIFIHRYYSKMCSAGKMPPGQTHFLSAPTVQKFVRGDNLWTFFSKKHSRTFKKPKCGCLGLPTVSISYFRDYVNLQ